MMSPSVGLEGLRPTTPGNFRDLFTGGTKRGIGELLALRIGLAADEITQADSVLPTPNTHQAIVATGSGSTAPIN
jgi:hypothetical protein